MGISRLESIIRNAESKPKLMGTNGILKISLKDLPHVSNHRSNPEIRTVVIDTSEFIYKSIIGGDHTSGILNFLEKMFRCEIMPIFVFDGKPPKEKTRIIEERKRVRERARERVLSLKGQISKADEILNIVTELHDSKHTLTDSLIDTNIGLVNGAKQAHSESPNTNLKDDIVEMDDVGNPVCYDTESYMNAMNAMNAMNLSYGTLYDILCDGAVYPNCTSSEEADFRDMLQLPTEDIIDKIRAKISTLYNETERMGKKTVGIQDMQYTDIKQLFNQFNIPYIHAGVEAEMICATLVKLGIADYCIGNDMDLFALGCPRIVRNLNFRDDFVDIYYLDTILHNLELSYTEFVDLCILLGSDYTGRLGGVKNFHILEYVQKYKSIEAILEKIDEINVGLVGQFTEDGMQRVARFPESFNYNEARAIFHTEFTKEQIASLLHIPLNDIYQSCANKCLELRSNNSVYDKTVEYCQQKCGRLNNMLIAKKINTIIWSNLVNETKADDFIMVKSKKTSPINTLGRRKEIINDIRSRSYQKNFSRVAFGSSPNHAMVMIS